MDVEAWVTSDTRSATTATIACEHCPSAFAYAVVRRWCDANPASRVERATENKPVAGYLSVVQATALLQHADADLRACVAIQLFAGLRPCEMVDLKFESINLNRSFLVVDTEEHTTSHRLRGNHCQTLREWLLPYAVRTGKGPATRLPETLG